MSRFKTVTVTAAFLWTGIFALAPVVMVLAASLMTRSETDFVAFPLTLEAYRAILSPSFGSIFFHSVRLAGATVILSLIVGYPFAYLIARWPSKRKTLFLLLVIIPFWTNSLIRTYALVFVLKTRGLINSVLLAAGVIQDPLPMLYTNAAVLAGLVYTLLPFMILPLYAAIEKLDSRLIEAAQDLGAGRFRTFLHVSLPLTAPGIVAGTVLVFLPALGMFYIPDILGGAKSMLVGNYIKNQFLTARDWPAGSAASVLLTVLMGLLLLGHRWSKTRIEERRG